MKKMKKIFIYLLLIISLLSFNSAYAQDKKAESQKLYLQASSLIRQENYQAAKSILEKIINDYGDMDIAIDADKKLSEILLKLTLSALPKVPGVYAKMKSSELLKFETEPITKAQLAKVGAATLDDVFNAPTVEYILFTVHSEVAADEIESFIVFSPNQPNMPLVNMCYAELIKEGTRKWVDEVQGSKGKNKYVLYSQWTDNATNGKTIKSDEIIKKKLADNIYEIKFPEGLSPKYNLFAINDGLGNAYPFVFNLSKAEMLQVKYINVWNVSDEAVTEINKAIKIQPNNANLFKMLSIINYRKGDFDSAIDNASKAQVLGKKDATYSSKDFEMIINFSKSAKNLKKIIVSPTNNMEELNKLIPLYENVLKENPNSYQAKYGLFYVHFSLKEYDKAIKNIEETLTLYEKLSNPKDVSYYLEPYQSKTKEVYETYLGLVKQEKIIKELNDSYIIGSGNIDEGINKGKEARKLAKTNPNYYDIMGQLYFKTGKFKDARKQMEEALDCAKKSKVSDLENYTTKLKTYQDAENSK